MVLHQTAGGGEGARNLSRRREPLSGERDGDVSCGGDSNGVPLLSPQVGVRPEISTQLELFQPKQVHVTWPK